jgi:putative MFS transporter
MFFGAAVSGMAADRFGRKSIFQISMLIWGLGSILCGLSHSLNALMSFRVVVGFGMGMEFPVAQAIASEITPKTHRGRYIALLEGFWPLGLICSGLIALVAIPLGGWRLVFLIEGIPALFLFVVRRNIPESPRWLVEAGRPEEAERVIADMERRVADATGSALPSFSATRLVEPAVRGSTPWADLWSKDYRGRTTMVWSLWFFALLGYYGITTWLSALLQARGYSIAKSTEYVILITTAGVPGFLTGAYLLDAIGRKPVTIASLVGGALFAYLYGTASSLMLLYGALMQFFLFAMWSALYAYTPELFPTRARATGAGLASAVGRLGSLIGPTLVGVLLPIYGQPGVFALGAIALCLAAGVVAVAGVETRTRQLEEISV